jgi:hypothetical protein
VHRCIFLVYKFCSPFFLDIIVDTSSMARGIRNTTTKVQGTHQGSSSFCKSKGLHTPKTILLTGLSRCLSSHLQRETPQWSWDRSEDGQEHSCDGDEFMNEVDNISKTSHANVVNFLGFCLQGSKWSLKF